MIAALDHAEIAEGPGGPAAMVPGQHHLRLNMYIAQARNGRFEIVETLGAIDPQERLVELPALVALTGDASNHPQMTKGAQVLLATTQIEDFDRFMDIFTTKGAEKRKEHGSKGALVFRDPDESDRVWVIFDWDADGWQSFVSDPEVPAIMQEAGHKGKPQAAAFAGECFA